MKKKSFLQNNGLTLALVLLFILSFVGQIMMGWHEYNDEMIELGGATKGLWDYLGTGHFLQSTFENWESEFLQMAMYVVLTVHLRQKGSSESKSMDKPEEVDREPNPRRKNAPWPVKKGGVALLLYKQSLSIAFLLLFILSFFLHASGSLHKYNEEQLLQGKIIVSFAEFMGKTRFWFESFQNWQSEFVAVLSIVVLSIFLRQQGSPESKPVDASMEETGS